MLAGFGGHLVAAGFLESSAGATIGSHDIEDARRQMKALRLRSFFGPASSLRTILETGAAPVLGCLGFDPPASVVPLERTLSATVTRNGRPVALLVTSWGERLDPMWRAAVTEARRRSAAWCLLFDGSRLRIVDAERLYARRHVEFDLDLALDDGTVFLALWRTAHASILTAPPADRTSLHALVAASDRHAAGVCRSLRDGVVAASSDVLAALVGGRRRDRVPLSSDSLEQALTIVYRLLFLLFAEARALVPMWHPIYRESYSVDALRHIAERGGATPGLWDTLRAMARLAHSGCRIGELRVTPFNGRLFSPSRTPLAERRDLDNAAARRAVLALSTRPLPEGRGRERISYRDLGVEQLGAVYETLLDYEPHLTTERRGTPTRNQVVVTLQPGSGIRKATGTFYTPQPIADYLVRRTLGPLTADATSDQILRLRVVDPAMGSGAFLVAACGYLAQAYEHALVREGACHASDFDESARAAMRRTIAERCLYGVDLNPMAVQLARLSLWLTTLASDRPLSFLDHRLQAGDSLLGAWIANLRHAPTPRRGTRNGNQPQLFADEDVAAAVRDALPVRFSLESTPNDSLEQVRAKERAFAAATAPKTALSRWKRIANLWCAAWFLARGEAHASAFGDLSDYVLTDRSGLPVRTAERHAAAADAVAAARRFFHWELEYPEVFFGPDGRRLGMPGFDAVLGNPPWDMIRADDSVSSDSGSSARDVAARTVRFAREASVYEAKSSGHANRYQLFVERAMALARRGGHIGLVLPWGFASDYGSGALRKTFFTGCDVDAVVGIDNRRAVFPIHRSVRFLLVTATTGRATNTVACRLDLDDPATLESLGDERADRSSWFPVRMTPGVIARISGSDLAIPLVRGAVDLAILERASALFPPLGSSSGWSARFGRELNATDDRALFRPRSGSSGLPIVEGKHLEPFRVALDAASHGIARADAKRRLRDERYERPRLAYRDVASATNRVTLIAAVLPAGCVSTHTVFCLRTPVSSRARHFLCGLFNSQLINYLVRMRVTTHVTTAIVERLPIPPVDEAPNACRRIAVLSRTLARGPHRDAFARLNALVANLFQLTAAEFAHVLATFPLIAQEDRDAAFRSFLETARPR